MLRQICLSALLAASLATGKVLLDQVLPKETIEQKIECAKKKFLDTKYAFLGPCDLNEYVVVFEPTQNLAYPDTWNKKVVIHPAIKETPYLVPLAVHELTHFYIRIKAKDVHFKSPEEQTKLYRIIENTEFYADQNEEKTVLELPTEQRKIVRQWQSTLDGLEQRYKHRTWSHKSPDERFDKLLDEMSRYRQ